MTQKSEGAIQQNDELLKALIDKAVDNGKGINEIRETLRRILDPTSTLQGLAESVGEQVARLDKSQATIEGINADVKKLLVQTAKDGSTEALRNEILDFRAFFRQPIKKEIHYRYFLGKPLLVHIPMIILIAVLSTLLVMNIGRANDHAANDIKWRYLKMNVSGGALGVLNSVEDKYRADPKAFSDGVEEEEDIRQQLHEKKMQEEKTRGDIDELEAKRKMR